MKACLPILAALLLAPPVTAAAPADNGHSVSKFDGRAPAASKINQATDLNVDVDRASQQITIIWPGGSIVDDVSTGGGYKEPNNPDNPQPPRCGETPATFEGAWGGDFSMYLEARPGENMFPDDQKTSTLYLNDDGEQIPLKWAIALNYPNRPQTPEGQGYYFHEVPRGKENLLGMAVSGGCIRLTHETAVRLYRLFEQYGRMSVYIHGENPRAAVRAQYPAPYNIVCKTVDGRAKRFAAVAKNDVIAKDVPAKRAPNPAEVVYGPVDDPSLEQEVQAADARDARRPRVNVGAGAFDGDEMFGETVKVRTRKGDLEVQYVDPGQQPRRKRKKILGLF